MKYRYLFILEVTPVEVGKTYDELPSHLTLMSRFFSDLSSEQLSEAIRSLFGQTPPITLTFGETAELGPKKLSVHMIEHGWELKQLHYKLRILLDSVDVEYEYPQFIGKNHKPHVTKRAGVQFEAGDKHTVTTACLIKIVDGKRVVRSKFELSGSGEKQSPHSPMAVFISGSINSGKNDNVKAACKRTRCNAYQCG